MRLTDLLRNAGVSRTAYYSLTRKESVLPKSINRLAQRLGVSPFTLLMEEESAILRIRELQRRTDEICHRYPDCDRDVVFRTLQNQDLPPIERLRRALIRAPRTHIH